MRIRRILAEAAVVATGTLFWLAVTALVGLPSRKEPPPAQASGGSVEVGYPSVTAPFSGRHPDTR